MGPNQHLATSAITTVASKCHLWRPFPLSYFKSIFYQFLIGPGECFPSSNCSNSGFGTGGLCDAISSSGSGRELEKSFSRCWAAPLQSKVFEQKQKKAAQVLHKTAEKSVNLQTPNRENLAIKTKKVSSHNNH